MTLEEFSNEFDVLVSSYRRFKDFDKQEILDSIEFNEYEKSVFLTKAQEELVLSLYNGKNPFGDSFESTEEMRRYLGGLVKDTTLEPTSTETSGGRYKAVFTLPSDLWFITLESAGVTGKSCEQTSTLDVFPVRQDEYAKLKKNPFRGPNERRVLRMDLNENKIELYSKYSILGYHVRYLKRLEPIVLRDFPDGLTVGDKGTSNPCKIHESLHRRILELAVTMALQSKGVGSSSEKDTKK